MHRPIRNHTNSCKHSLKHSHAHLNFNLLPIAKNYGLYSQLSHQIFIKFERVDWPTKIIQLYIASLATEISVKSAFEAKSST